MENDKGALNSNTNFNTTQTQLLNLWEQSNVMFTC